MNVCIIGLSLGQWYGCYEIGAKDARCQAGTGNDAPDHIRVDTSRLRDFEDASLRSFIGL